MRMQKCLDVGSLTLLTLAFFVVLVLPEADASGPFRRRRRAVPVEPVPVAPVADQQPNPEQGNLIQHRAPNPNPTAAYKWMNIMLEVTGNDVDRVGARPTIISRQMAIPATAMYDAWAAYDDKAVGTRLGGKLRRPSSERTQANKEKAIAYAMYHTLADQFPLDRELLGKKMREMGFDPTDASTDTTTPQGIGNVAAQAVLDYRRRDGANQLGDEVGSNGQPYSDYTFYKPVNPRDKCLDPDCWQQIAFDNPKGPGKIYPNFLTPHWYRVKPFGLKSSNQFRPGPPHKVGSEQMQKEVDEIIAVNANLTLEMKATVEFMRDGPRSTGQSGHWLQFAQDVSRRDKHDLDRDVKLFFAILNTAMDTFISCWEAKRFYDGPRPYALVHHYYKGKKIHGWGGPGKGTVEMLGEEWRPYSPAIFVTPPFPGYTSGHSTVSAGCSKILELFTGSDKYGAYEKRKAGIFTEDEFDIWTMMQVDGKKPTDPKLTKEVTLMLPTFSATAEMAAISRMWGGYHVRVDNEIGLVCGRKAAEYLWPVFQSYFNGTATIRN